MFLKNQLTNFRLPVFTLFIILFFINNAFTQSLKRGDIKIVEIMYNSPEAGTDTLEFIEFYNTTSSTIDLSGCTLAGVTLTIPANVSIPAKGRLVFSGDSARHRKFYNNYSIKWKSGTLTNSGEVLGIKTPAGVWIDSLKYGAATPWPKEPNGNGPSLVLCNENADNKNPSNWSVSFEAVGIVNSKMVKATPGTGCFDPNAGKDIAPPKLLGIQALTPQKLVLTFNEPLVENAKSISNFEGLPAINSTQFSNKRDSVIIILSQPLQRGKFYTLSFKNIRDTAGNLMTPTATKFVFNDSRGDLFITEIMYYGPDAEDSYEFIEIYNATTEQIPLGGLNLSPSVSAVLPDSSLAPGAYFVIAKDSAKFRALYKTTAWQWNSGELNNDGDVIFLSNTIEQTIDSVIFSNSFPWTPFAAGTGSSLVLCDALNSSKNHPSAWSAGVTIMATDNAGNKYFTSPGSACNSAYLPEPLQNKKKMICGNTILDAGNMGAKFKWNTGQATQTIPVNKAGKYYVLIVNGAGALMDTFYLDQLKAIAIFDTIVCANEVVQFTDNTPGAKTRTWFFSDHEKSYSADTHYVFTSPGLITVKLVVSDSFCTDTLEKKIFVRNCTTSMSLQAVLISGFDIFPNPSKGEFTINIKAQKPDNMTVEVFDMQGRIIISLQKNNAQEWLEKINLPDNKKGIYMIRVKTGTETNTEKLIIY